MEFTTKGIKRIMAIVRPAIISLYGRQPLQLFSYKIDLIYANTTRRYNLAIKGKNGSRFFVELVDNKEKVPGVTQVLKYEDVSVESDLLAALEGLLSVVNVRIDDPRIAQFDAARAAIAKAKGE